MNKLGFVWLVTSAIQLRKSIIHTALVSILRGILSTSKAKDCLSVWDPESYFKKLGVVLNSTVALLLKG